MIVAVLLLALLQPAPDARLRTAETEIAAGRDARAAEILDSLVSTGKAAPEAYILLAGCRLRLKQPDRVIDTLEAALQAHPASPAVLKFAGQLLFRFNPENAQAGDLLQKAATAAPSDPEVHHFYAEWAFLNHREEVAVAEMKKVLALEPSNDLVRLQAFTLLALAYDRLKRDNDADDAFRRALEANRRVKDFDPRSALEYARFLSRSGRGDEAQAVLEDIVKRVPAFAPAHLEKAKNYDAAEKRDKAIAEAELALKLEGNQDTELRAAHVLLARLYYEDGQEAKAEAHQKWVRENQKK